jgi:hypothetical protein
MTVTIVKTNVKNDLDTLVATLTLRLGHKVTQQDVLDACIKLGLKKLDDVEMVLSGTRAIPVDIVDEIIESAEDIDYKSAGTIDEDVYGEH